MTASLAWPALQSTSLSLPLRLDHARGVWGKVQGASSDFRWIASSDGFNHHGSGLERALNLGAEDDPRRMFCWHPLFRNAHAVGYCAVVGYPSRAVDAVGRRDFLEKQVLEWSYSPELPAALGALLLLPVTASWTDAIWWSRYREQPWSQPEFALPIAVADYTPVICSEERLADAIEWGLQALLTAVDPQSLKECYARLLTGQRPACLYGLSQPLAPEALAALLLPLDRRQADRLSLAGWIPSRHYSLEELGNRWDVLVVPETAPLPVRSAATAGQLETAGRMVEALQKRQPEWLAAPPAVTLTGSIGREPPPVIEPVVDKAMPANPLNDPDRPILPGALLTLTEPGPNAPSFIHALYGFARAVDRRWLDPARLEADYPQGIDPLPTPSSEAGLLRRWVQEVESQRPYYADKAQWQVKVDLLRALALVLAPSPATLSQVGLPQSERIPTLLYAVLLKEPAAKDALAALGTDGLSKIIRQSLDCRMFPKIQSWLSDWRLQTAEESVCRVIDAVLA
ncbi:MAG: hypothetical protein U1F76_06585 [Candidatus Competibacteraceae bacterium]